MSLNADEFTRYSQQFTLKEIGIAGQLKLKAARVLCIGAGGLGSPLLLYLAAAGVGHLGIVDHDDVQLSNLHRQILYQQSDIGLKKVAAAKQHLLALNPNIDIAAHAEKFTTATATQLISDYDIIADCTDNFDAHYLINDTCVERDKPYVFAAIHQFQGQCSLFLAKRSPCYRCVFPSKPAPALIPNCREAGVLGVLPGFLGIIQANEILKYVLGINKNLAHKLLQIDMLNMTFREFRVTHNNHCVTCNMT